uniref:Uncharacterized protein n=1 Tax=Triticum urartu TaxID=4572 RepID=A0A8R7PKM8_TRIUA
MEGMNSRNRVVRFSSGLVKFQSRVKAPSSSAPGRSQRRPSHRLPDVAWPLSRLVSCRAAPDLAPPRAQITGQV